MTKITLSPILTVMLTAVSHGQNISTERERVLSMPFSLSTLLILVSHERIVTFESCIIRNHQSQYPITKNTTEKKACASSFQAFSARSAFIKFRSRKRYLISFSSQPNALAPNTAASESFNSEASNLVLPL